VLALIEHARAEVERQFGVTLDLEIELVGEWDTEMTQVAMEGNL
jgi:UDP-N-acetylenolpyruvoylglucosamine reductase